MLPLRVFVVVMMIAIQYCFPMNVRGEVHVNTILIITRLIANIPIVITWGVIPTAQETPK
jgi:hypothetical protein